MEKFENLAKDEVLAKAGYEFVMDLFGGLKKKRKPFEALWAECNDAYRGKEAKTWFQGSGPYCSSDLRDSVLTIVPKMVKAIWYQDMPVDLIPIGEEGDDDELAEVNKQVLTFDFRNLKVYIKYVDSMFQKAIFGTTIVKTPPHFEMITKNLRFWEQKKLAGFPIGNKALNRKTEFERTFMGTDFIPVDIYDFWIDPATVGSGYRDAVEFSDCIESICIKQTDLMSGKEDGIYVNITDDVLNGYVGAKKSSQDQSFKDRVKRTGHIEQSESGLQTAVKDKGNKNYEIKECYADFDLGNGPEPCLIVTAADKKCVRIQKWPDHKPYLSSRYIQNGYNKEFYGTGVIETNLSNHYERNATRKQLIAARTLGLNMEVFSSSAGLVNKPDKLRSAAGKVHYVRDINAVKPFEKGIGPILQSAIAYETMVKSETQTSTGNTPYVQGTDVSRINDTATGIMALQQAGLEKFTLPIQLDETGMLEPYVKRCLNNNILYRTEAFVIRLTDKKPVKVYPEDLSANFDVYAKGSSELQQKATRQVALLKAWEIDIQAAQLEMALYGKPLTNFFELKKEIHANLGLSNPDQYVIDPTDTMGKLPTLPPNVEWIMLQRMRDGAMPVMPILIQPGEDYRKHYEDHVAKVSTEEYQLMPEPLKQVWNTHINSYGKVLNLLEERKREEIQEDEIKSKKVEVSR